MDQLWNFVLRHVEDDGELHIEDVFSLLEVMNIGERHFLALPQAFLLPCIQGADHAHKFLRITASDALLAGILEELPVMNVQKRYVGGRAYELLGFRARHDATHIRFHCIHRCVDGAFRLLARLHNVILLLAGTAIHGQHHSIHDSVNALTSVNDIFTWLKNIGPPSFQILLHSSFPADETHAFGAVRICS